MLYRCTRVLPPHTHMHMHRGCKGHNYIYPLSHGREEKEGAEKKKKKSAKDEGEGRQRVSPRFVAPEKQTGRQIEREKERERR